MTSPDGAPAGGHRTRRSSSQGISLRWKLFILSGTIVIGGFVLLYLLADRTLQSHLYQEIEKGLVARSAAAGRALASTGLPHSPADLRAILRDLAPSVDARIRIYSGEGTLLGDSVRDQGEAPGAASNLEQGELRSVIESSGPRVARKGPPGGAQLMSAVTAVSLPRGERIVLRLDAPLLSVAEARSALLSRFLLVGVFVLALLSLAGAITIRSARRHIESLETSALALARGDFSRPIDAVEDEELDELAEVLETARTRLIGITGEVAGQRDRLQEILDTMEDGVLMADPEGRVVLLNPAMHRLFDLPPEPVGRRVAELIRAPELQAVLEGEAPDQPAPRGEIDVSRAGVGNRRVMVRVAPIRKQAGEGGAVVVFHDVTEMRKLEQMRQDFIANVSHELKTPLTAVRGYAETLAEKPPQDPAQARSFVDTILKHTRRLAALVDDLLELSRIESGQAALVREPVTLRGPVDRVVHAFGPAATGRNLKLSVSVPEDLPPILADPLAIETILSNLVENAVKYANDGGQVAISAGTEDGWLRLDVSDTGPGIPPAHVPRLFERFYRVDPSRSRELGGTGLGLAIVKHLSQALGGRASVQSDPGRGSVFTVHLPLPGPEGNLREP